MLDDPRTESILRDSEEKWGREMQIDTAIEELSELISALCRYRRGRVDEGAVTEEIADVKLASKHLAMIYGEEEVANHLQKKINRLEERVSE